MARGELIQAMSEAATIAVPVAIPSGMSVPVARVRDWPERLDAVFRAHGDVPFTWGEHDCCLFAANCVQAVTGIDVAADLRGTYADAAGAARTLAGVGGPEALCDARLFERVPVAAAHVGDVGIATLGGRESLVVCGGMLWHGAATHGLGLVNPAHVRAAWRVG